MEAGQTIDGYVFEKQLGRGGMAEVWAARETGSKESVAVKILLPEFVNNNSIRQRFEREAKLTLITEARPLLSHPHIVPILKTVHVEGRPGLIMPLYSGGSLESRIRPDSGRQNSGRGEPLPLRDVLQISNDVLTALNHAHERGTIHRDVKPANILLDHEGRAYLADFGTATEMKRMLVTRFAGGTPLWTSPEQIQTPRKVGHLADLYSFGCCIYDMLTGRPPFDADEEEDTAWVFAVQTKHVREDPTPIRTWNPGVPAALDNLVLESLRKAPSERVPGCREFSLRLEEIEQAFYAPKKPLKTDWNHRNKSPVGIDADPDPEPPERRRRMFDQREFLWAAALIVFLMCLVAVQALSYWLEHRKPAQASESVSQSSTEGSKPIGTYKNAIPATLPTNVVEPTPSAMPAQPPEEDIPENQGGSQTPTPARVAPRLHAQKSSIASAAGLGDNEARDEFPKQPTLPEAPARGYVPPAGMHTIGDSGAILAIGHVKLVFLDAEGAPVPAVTLDLNGKHQEISSNVAELTVPLGVLHVQISKPGFRKTDLSFDVSSTITTRQVVMEKLL